MSYNTKKKNQTKILIGYGSIEEYSKTYVPSSDLSLLGQV
jgi:hypothetical protein